MSKSEPGRLVEMEERIREFEARRAAAFEQLTSPDSMAQLPRFHSWKLSASQVSKALMHAAALGSATIGPFTVTYSRESGYEITRSGS